MQQLSDIFVRDIVFILGDKIIKWSFSLSLLVQWAVSCGTYSTKSNQPINRFAINFGIFTVWGKTLKFHLNPYFRRTLSNSISVTGLLIRFFSPFHSPNFCISLLFFKCTDDYISCKIDVYGINYFIFEFVFHCLYIGLYCGSINDVSYVVIPDLNTYPFILYRRKNTGPIWRRHNYWGGTILRTPSGVFLQCLIFPSSEIANQRCQHVNISDYKKKFLLYFWHVYRADTGDKAPTLRL